ncbi:RES family NAD+ phosphorylase [Arsenicicoccus dermatophilus]|uniref:RES family NAD+ phosphorylase n=1 Tax=Arsenicicoccus dermatophilus TaxID=1076331 RepID=UPI003917311D
MTSAYEQVDIGGRPLVSWLREDWGIFAHPVMDDAHAKELLADVLDDGDIVRKNFLPANQESPSTASQWQVLRTGMMHSNRWFADHQIDLSRLRDLLDLLVCDDFGPDEEWFRCRLMDGVDPYPADQMGAPPPHLASGGRANPAGIPYLYVASDVETCVAETRPHTGDFASIAQFRLPRVRLVDLRSPRAAVSPFILADSDGVLQLRADVPLLEALGEELTKPVLPRTAAYEYVPSQYLCEFIKNCGFDGVLYQSSVGDGVNLALFEPSEVACEDVSAYLVRKVGVTVEASKT